MSKVKKWFFEVIVPLIWYTFALPPVNWKWLKIDSIKTKYYDGLTDQEIEQHAGSHIHNGDTLKTDIFCNPILEEKATDIRETGFIVNGRVIKFYTIRNRWRKFTWRFARSVSFVITFWYKIPYNLGLFATASLGLPLAKKSLVHYINYYWKSPTKKDKFLPRLKLLTSITFWAPWSCNIVVATMVDNDYIGIFTAIVAIYAGLLYVVASWSYYRVAQIINSKVPAFRESYVETLEALLRNHKVEMEVSGSIHSYNSEGMYVWDIARTINMSPTTGCLCVYAYGMNCTVITRYTSALKNRVVYDLHIQDRLVSIKIFEPKFLKLF